MRLEDGMVGTTEEEMNSPQLRHMKAVKFFRNRGPYPRNLLDIGCGNGTVTSKLREGLPSLMAGGIFGVDLLADRLECPDWLEIRKVDLERDSLPFRKDTFEYIYCGEVLEHLYDPDHLLEEVKRVLHPKGVCLFTTPNLASWYNRIAILMGYQPCSISASYWNEGVGKLVRPIGHRDHVRGFTLKALEELLKIHKLKIVKKMGWNMGVGEDYIKYRIVSRSIHVVDVVMAKFPSLGARLAVAVSK